jgi:flagellar biosynthesis/type III secretory pathway protein FliH
LSSRSRSLRVRVTRAPSRARLVAEDRERLLERVASARERLAFEAGREEGRREERLLSAGALSRAAERLDSAREEAAAGLASDAVALALEIARVLVRRSIDLGTHDVERIVRETLAASGVGRGTCVVHLNPADAERLERVPFRAGTRIEADHEIAAGDVHVTTPHGVLVRDQDDAFAAIAERIRGELA